jgi:hypothetical protein
MKKETKIEALNFKNYQLELLSKMLDVPLHSEKARARNRFFKVVQPKIQTKNTEHDALLVKYGKKSDKEKNQFTIKPESLEKFSAEIKKLNNEPCIIDLLPSVKADMPAIKDILKNSKVEMNITETEIYEEIMTEIEKC